MDPRNDSPWSHLEQDDQSSGSTSPISLRSSSGDLELIGDGSDLDLLNMDYGALPKQESGQDASDANVGRTACDASRGCDTSPNIE